MTHRFAITILLLTGCSDIKTMPEDDAILTSGERCWRPWDVPDLTHDWNWVDPDPATAPEFETEPVARSQEVCETETWSDDEPHGYWSLDGLSMIDDGGLDSWTALGVDASAGHVEVDNFKLIRTSSDGTTQESGIGRGGPSGDSPKYWECVSSPIGDLSCGPTDGATCSGYYSLRAESIDNDFQPVERSPEECSDRFDDVDVCLKVWEAGAAKVVSDQSSCVPGSGDFKLIPYRFWDLDGDGVGMSVWVPAQLNGTGSMTRESSVRSIRTTGDILKDIRVIHAGALFRPDESGNESDKNRLEGANQVSTRLKKDKEEKFATGVVDGLPPFVVEDIEGSQAVDLRVAMDWTCEAEGIDRRSLSQGYLGTSAAFGCGDIAQGLVLRPRTDKKELSVEFYGNPSYPLVTPVKLLPDATWAFDVVAGGLHAKGAFKEAPVSLKVKLDTLTWHGEDICATGTVELPPE